MPAIRLSRTVYGSVSVCQHETSYDAVMIASANKDLGRTLVETEFMLLKRAMG